MIDGRGGCAFAKVSTSLACHGAAGETASGTDESRAIALVVVARGVNCALGSTSLPEASRAAGFSPIASCGAPLEGSTAAATSDGKRVPPGCSTRLSLRMHPSHGAAINRAAAALHKPFCRNDLRRILAAHSELLGRRDSAVGMQALPVGRIEGFNGVARVLSTSFNRSLKSSETIRIDRHSSQSSLDRHDRYSRNTAPYPLPATVKLVAGGRDQRPIENGRLGKTDSFWRQNLGQVEWIFRRNWPAERTRLGDHVATLSRDGFGSGFFGSTGISG